jgi:hypothetical protein
MVNWAVVIVIAAVTAQLSPRMNSLVEAVRPALPFPSSAPAGDVPADNGAAARWFVVWPTSADDTRIIVRANPLNPEVQKASAEAMEEINAAVAAAERRAQASYDRALERLRKTGSAGELDPVTLDDEGVAGERIDAELEVTIELAEATSFDIASADAPVVQPGSAGVSWIVGVSPNTYRPTTGDDRREHFRAAETRLYFGVMSRPEVTRLGDEQVYRVALPPPSAGAFAVIIRGNAALVSSITTGADWRQLAPR